MNTHWTVSHGMSGYLPMGDDNHAWTDWSDARDGLIADMKWYADADDDAAWDNLTMNANPDDYARNEDGSPDYGDDAPTMLACVESMVADGDVAPVAGEEWSGWIEDAAGITIYFSLSRHDASECDGMCELVDSDD